MNGKRIHHHSSIINFSWMPILKQEMFPLAGNIYIVLSL